MRRSGWTALVAWVLATVWNATPGSAQATLEFPSYRDAMNCRFFSLTGMAHFRLSDTARAQKLNADSFVFGVIGQVTFDGNAEAWVSDMKTREDAHWARLKALPKSWLDRTIRRELDYCAELKNKHALAYAKATVTALKHFGALMDEPVTELGKQ